MHMLSFHQTFRWLVLVPLACSSTGGAGDAMPTPDSLAQDAPTAPRLGPTIELPLLPSADPSRPFNHSAEVSIAAVGEVVVVAAIHMHFARADSFDVTGFHKRVGIWTSTDRGVNYSDAIDPGLGDQTTDPVVRASRDGTLWHAFWDTNGGPITLAKSTDNGYQWVRVVADHGGDKPWFAIDDTNEAIYLADTAGYYKYTTEGTLIASSAPGTQMANAYVDDTGALFATAGLSVQGWDGEGEPTTLAGPFPAGENAELTTRICWATGRTNLGDIWAVHATRNATTANVVLRVVDSAGQLTYERNLNGAGTAAYFPSAIADSQGRVHAMWYEDQGATAVVKYTHSRSSDLIQGFRAPLVVDANAAPGDGWYPAPISDTGQRRLREYIDIAVTGQRAHIAWTHAPRPPARVRVSYVDFR